MADEDDRHTSMQFCQECNNLMYPREVMDHENPQDSRLVYVCKAPNCVMSSRQRNECSDADSTLVWKHVVQHAMKADELINTDIVQDPTQPRTNHVTCENVSSAAHPAPCPAPPRSLPRGRRKQRCAHAPWRLTADPACTARFLVPRNPLCSLPPPRCCSVRPPRQYTCSYRLARTRAFRSSSSAVNAAIRMSPPLFSQ